MGKAIQVPSNLFFQMKPVLDMAVFWRKIDKDTIEVKPCFKFAREYIERNLAQERRVIMRP